MKLFKNTLKFASIAFLAIAATSCEAVYDYEGDCSSNWRVQFLYKMHPGAITSLTGEGNDEFSQTVRSVQLFVYDSKTGEYVTDYTASGEYLGSGYWTMPIDLEPGEYDFLVWAHGHADKSKAFQSIAPTKASLARTDHAWRVIRDEMNNHLPWNEEAWNPVHSFFYGEAKGNVVTDEVGDHLLYVELMKNTNHINVTVQFTSEDIRPEEFYVQWIADNGHLDAFNNPVKGDVLTYKPFKEFILDDDVVIAGDGQVKAGTKYSSIGVSRMMVDHQGDAKLEIRRTDDDSLIYSIDLLRWICNLHDGDDKSDQYYLDCQDDYNCHIMLTPSGAAYAPMRININNWVVVPEQTGTIG